MPAYQKTSNRYKFSVPFSYMAQVKVEYAFRPEDQVMMGFRYSMVNFRQIMYDGGFPRYMILSITEPKRETLIIQIEGKEGSIQNFIEHGTLHEPSTYQVWEYIQETILGRTGAKKDDRNNDPASTVCATLHAGVS